MAFNGYLLKATATKAIFPNQYIEVASYEATPNIREEIKAVRDEYTRDLIRVTAEGTKTRIRFSTLELHLSQLREIIKFFTDAETDHLQRKLELEYWNDEELAYKTGTFYRADIQYTKKEISANDIIYEPIDIELVEY